MKMNDLINKQLKQTNKRINKFKKKLITSTYIYERCKPDVIDDDVQVAVFSNVDKHSMNLDSHQQQII